MIKTLKRTVIMREYDFNKIVNRSPEGMIYVKDGLYDYAEFQPCLRVALEQEFVLRILRGTIHSESDTMPISITALLYNLRDRLYNRNYCTNWHHEEDDRGQIWIWHRSNTPKTRLGLATFVRKYTVRDRLTDNSV